MGNNCVESVRADEEHCTLLSRKQNLRNRAVRAKWCVGLTCCSEEYILVDNAVDFNVKASTWYDQSKVFPDEHLCDSLITWRCDFDNSLDILIEDEVIDLSQSVSYIASKRKQKRKGKVIQIQGYLCF